ncbi:hypothetical protein [Lederbergia lenta]|uniref:hypothetical protein n=1 Tax=Lederbergia lenta TaxID=1467 RepID=UPI002040C6E0|nr:hypothetical protein [Lederbergia lenta]MCM3109856.1 hypothetical protein [Lederbergia lenta]
MAKKTNYGKEFESSVEESCTEQSIFYFRVRDVFLPPDLRARVRVPQNRYDCLIYHKGYLFPVEMKSTKAKSISFSESMIKANQIKNLNEATRFSNVIPGFLFNFREPENRTFFIHISEFLKYKNIAENELENTYESRVNKSSIPIGICEEIGTELSGIKKKVKYRYWVGKLIDELIGRFNNE